MATITVRQMIPSEAVAVLKIGRRAFAGLESLWVSTPKQALVAEKEGQIVGAILYKYIKSAGKKIGYVDYAFVHPDFHNQGVGNVLYKAATDFLWEQGCDALTAVVKDDNVGSWGLFQKNGFTRVSLPALARQFGPLGMLKQYFGTPFCIGIGMEYYVAQKGEGCPSGKGGSVKQVLSFFLANVLLTLLPVLTGRFKDATTFFCAYLALLLLGVVSGFIGTRFSANRGWKFRLNNGGALVCALLNFGTTLPMIGNWYPAQYEKSKGFRRDMGATSFVGWVFLFAVTAFAVFGGFDSIFTRFVGQIGMLLLLYRVIPAYPFESFGGKRILNWNKWVYFAMTLCTLALVIYTFVFL